MTPLSMTVSPEGVATLQIAEDAAPYLSPEFVGELQQAVGHIQNDPRVKAVVFVGTGRYFSAGASRESLVAANAAETVRRYVVEVPRALLDLPVPSVAAMRGHAVGGGLLVGLWCTVQVLATQSLYGANFMALGFTPGMGSTHAMLEHFGAPLGRRLLYSGALMTGSEIAASRCPLSHAVVDRDEVEAAAYDLASSFAAQPREPLLLLTQTLNTRRRVALEAAVQDETRMHGALFGRAATSEAIRDRYGAAFDATPREAQ